MTDEEITQSLTNAMRLLNESSRQLKIIHASINIDEPCPLCLWVSQMTAQDIETIDKTRAFLIEQSQQPDRDEKIVAATKAIGVVAALAEKAQTMKAMADIAHDAFEAIGRARVEAIVVGEEGETTKEMFERAMREAGFTKHKYDPSKAN